MSLRAEVVRAFFLLLAAGGAGYLAFSLAVAFTQPPAPHQLVAVDDDVLTPATPAARALLDEAETLFGDGERLLRVASSGSGGVEAWLALGRSVLEAPTRVGLPFRETVWFDADRPAALAYRFDVPRGRRIEVTVELDAAPAEPLFADLFRVGANGREGPVHVASATAADQRVDLAVVDDGTYILRLQPELRQGGRFTVNVRTRPALLFPVAGFDSRAIQSPFGVERDGGRRTHRGVDIFAPHGTPVVAGADGEAVWVGELKLGGKVVWLELEGGHNLYYAHLADYAVTEGERVRAGDVLGWVGNTGNARTTPPHLHFGVYLDVRDAVDPSPFLRRVDAPLPAVAVATERLGGWARPIGDEVRLLGAPDTRAPVVARLGPNTAFRLEGATRGRYRVRLRDDTVGYIAANDVEPLAAGAEATPAIALTQD